jgi:hypothetical protein
MTQESLRVVVSLDPEAQSFRPSAHNLTASQAVDYAQTLKRDGVDTKIADQSKRHRTEKPEGCRQCKKTADALTAELHSSPGSQKRPEQNATTATEGEEPSA